MVDFVSSATRIEGSWCKQSSRELVVATHLDRITHLEGRHSFQDSLEWGVQYTVAPCRVLILTSGM